MKQLQRRLLILASVALLSTALVAIQSIATRHVLADTFATLEWRQGQRSLDQALKALEADLNQLAISSHDYAPWDDMYEYVETRNRRFVESNLTLETPATCVSTSSG